MRFGDELKASMVQAWRTKYVRYALIKSKIKELKKLCEARGIPLGNDGHLAMTDHMDPAPAVIDADTSINKMDGQGGVIEDSQSRSEKMVSVGKKHTSGRHGAVHIRDELTVLEAEGRLEGLVPRCPQEIRMKEKEIALMLEMDLYTVSKFYAEQCRYFSEQHNRLIARIKMLKERVRETDANGSSRGTDGAAAAASSSVSGGSEEDSGSNSDSGLEHEAASEEVTGHELEERKSSLRLLFRQTYHAVRMLEEYRAINVMAFEKITKKHDKNSGHFKALRAATRRLIKSECNFGRDYFTKFLQQRLEYLYSLHLRPSEQTKGQAIQRLRHPPSEKSVQTESCVIGLCGGWSIAVFLAMVVMVSAMAPPGFWRDLSVKRSWYIFTASTLVAVYLWLWGCDLWVFQKCHFNHGFIFGADPTTLMRVPTVWNIAAIVSVTTMFLSFFFALSYLDRATFQFEPEIMALIGFIVWALFLFAPIPAIQSTKRFLCRSMFKQIISPFSTVEFIDFFLADQWCSLFSLLDDLAFTACYTATGAFFGAATSDSSCDSAATKAVFNLLKITPYWIRFWQCIRRAYDKRRADSPFHWHLANAGKYGTAILVVVINSLYIRFHDVRETKWLAVGFGAIATLYAFFWDIYKDWGLLRWAEHREHKLLRKELTYPAVAYYAAIAVNFVGRFAWAVALYPAAFGIHDLELMHFINLPLSLAEIGRRCMWNVFRLENEHLNNVGEFRVVRDIPLVRCDSIREIKIEIDVNRRAEEGHHQSGGRNGVAVKMMNAVNLAEARKGSQDGDGAAAADPVSLKQGDGVEAQIQRLKNQIAALQQSDGGAAASNRQHDDEFAAKETSPTLSGSVADADVDAAVDYMGYF